MIMTLHASLIKNSSNDQINSQTKVNLRLKNGRLIHARFLIGGFKVIITYVKQFQMSTFLILCFQLGSVNRPEIDTVGAHSGSTTGNMIRFWFHELISSG